MKPSELVDIVSRLYKDHQLSPTLEKDFLNEIEKATFPWEDLYDAFRRLKDYGIDPYGNNWRGHIFKVLCDRAQNDAQVIKLAAIWEQDFSWNPGTFWDNEKNNLQVFFQLNGSGLIDSTLPETINDERGKAKAFFQLLRDSSMKNSS